MTGYDDWLSKQYHSWPWYIKLYYHWYGVVLSIRCKIERPLDLFMEWYRLKTNTHAKWCCSQPPINGYCCCQKGTKQDES